MKRKQKYLMVTLLTAMLTGITGCSLSEEQKEEAERYQKQAEKNAVTYIKEKYDVDAKVVDSEYNRTGMFADAVSSYVNVEMEYGEETFDVYMIGNKSWEEVDEYYKKFVCDNYQYDEIYSDAKKYLEDKTGVTIAEMDIDYSGGNEDTDLEHMANQYYEGDFEAFKTDVNVYITLVTTDTNPGRFDGLDFEGGKLTVYSYEEDYYQKHGHTIENGYVHKGALWLNWSAQVSFNQVTMVEYEKHEFGLGYIVAEKGSDVEIRKTTADAENWVRNGFENPEAVSDAYTIEADKELYVFIESEDNDEALAAEYRKGTERKYERNGSSEGGYIISVLDMDRYNGEVNIVVLED